MPSQSGSGLSLPGVASDGAGGLAVSGGLALDGITPDPAYPVQLGSDAFVVFNNGAWTFGVLYVSANSSTVPPGVVLNVGDVFQVQLGFASIITFFGGTFTFEFDTLSLPALQASTMVQTPVLQLVPTGTPGAPASGAHTAGAIIMDSTGALFVCTASGTPGTWKTVTLT